MQMAITELSLSARAYDHILKVSRPIADLAGSEQVQAEHVELSGKGMTAQTHLSRWLVFSNPRIDPFKRAIALAFVPYTYAFGEWRRIQSIRLAKGGVMVTSDCLSTVCEPSSSSTVIV